MKMEKQEYKYEYSNRSSVDGHFLYSKNNSKQKKEVVTDKNIRKNKLRCTRIQFNMMHNIKQETENTKNL